MNFAALKKLSMLTTTAKLSSCIAGSDFVSES